MIYEVNVRQYTPEGTFEAFSKHLDRLEQMDVDILWFMPIYPISETNRKGSLGSYYAISDYTAINPEYGTMEEFSIAAIMERIWTVSRGSRIRSHFHPRVRLHQPHLPVLAVTAWWTLNLWKHLQNPKQARLCAAAASA